MIGIVIFGLLAGFITDFFIRQNGHYETEINKTELRQNIRATLDLITREMRMAGYDPADAGISGIVFDDDTLKIRADINGDGNCSNENESIDYYFDTNQLTLFRETGGAKEGVMEDVESFTFGFKDADGNSVSSAGAQQDIRRIELSITGRTATPDYRREEHGGYKTYTMKTLIIPRNLAL
jgi:type IV pilus assembly protein PilW